MRIIFLRSNPLSPDVRAEKEMYSLSTAGFDVLALGWDRECKYKKEEVKKICGKRTIIYRIQQRATYGGGFKKNILPLVLFELKLGYWLLKNREKYDIIHACDLDTALIAYVVSRITKKKYVYDIFDYYVDCYHVPRKMKKIIEKIDHKVIMSAYKTIICTERRKEQIGIKEKNDYLVIHNAPLNVAIDKNLLALNKGSCENKIKIVYVGGLSKDRFLKELVEVVENTPEVELHMGGFGILEEFIRSVSERCDNIFYYGKISYSETLSLESKCDFLAAFYPTDNRNHIYAAPNKFYEALMLKKPIIMVKDSGTAELAEKIQFGIFVDSSRDGVREAIALVKKTVKTDFNYEKAYEIFIREFQWDIMGEKLVKMYKNIVL